MRLCAAAVTEGTLFAFVDYEDKLSAARALKALAGKSVPQLSGGWVGGGGRGGQGWPGLSPMAAVVWHALLRLPAPAAPAGGLKLRAATPGHSP